MKKSNKINIIPNTSLWMKLGRTKYTIPKAIGELIDNALDNKVDEHVNVNVYFDIDGDYIGILDDGTGMNLETLTRALTIAEHIEDDNKIGEHGFGLESASSYLGKNLTIYTKTESMNKYLKFKYNQNDFLAKNDWSVEYEYITKKALRKETNINFDRGTYIKIDDLNIRLYKGLISSKADNVDGTMITKFQSIYKKFIEKDILNLNLYVGFKNENIKHIKIEAPKNQNLAFKINFDFTFNNNNKELKVSGWAGILDFYDENKRNKKKYTSGFDVISKNKVILQHIHPGYSYHPEKRLVLGEMELNNFQTTSDKTDFIRNSDWQSLELILNQYVTKPILYLASTAYLNNLNEKINQNEDFNLNSDYNKVLARTAINDYSLDEFRKELMPATLLSANLVVEEEVFDSAKKHIIDYMKEKKAIIQKQTEPFQKNRYIELEASVTLDEDENKTIVPIVSKESYLEPNTKIINIQNFTNKPNNLDKYDITFNHQGLTIKHQLDNFDDNKMYDFELDNDNGIITIKSNRNAFNSLYSSLESFCIANIINSIIDNSIIKASEENELNKDIVLTIKNNVLKTFISSQSFFKENVKA